MLSVTPLRGVSCPNNGSIVFSLQPPFVIAGYYRLSGFAELSKTADLTILIEHGRSEFVLFSVCFESCEYGIVVFDLMDKIGVVRTVFNTTEPFFYRFIQPFERDIEQIGVYVAAGIKSV